MAIWFIFTLISVFAGAVAEISQKVSLTQKVNVHAITNNFYVWGLMGMAGFLFAKVTGNFSTLSNAQDILKLIILGIVYFLGGTLFYSSYKGNSPSISQILASVSIIITTSLGIIFFKEGMSFYKLLGTILILLAIFLLNITTQEKFNKHNLLAFFGGICYGLAYTLDKSFSLNMHPFSYLFWMSTTVALTSFVIRPIVIISDTRNMVLHDFRPIFTSFFFFTIFDLCSFFAYKNGASVGVVDSMNSISIFLVIIAEILFLKDRKHIVKKFVSASLAIVGVSLFSLIK